MPGSTVSTRPRIGQMVRLSFAAMSPQERARVIAMYGVIAGLHVLGFFIFFVFVVPSHYKGLGIGVSILAYTLGLRHAFDADHISAIDNTTRKVLGERQGTGQPRPFGFGFFFSLGHSTIVVAIGVGIIVAEKTVLGAVSNSGSALERFGGLFGTIVSASFLFLIGLLNLVILAGIVRVFRLDAPRRLRRGRAGAPAGEPRLLLPVLRPVDEGHHQGVADLPGRGASSGWASTPRPRSPCWPPPRCWPPSTSPGTRSCACRSCSPPG